MKIRLVASISFCLLTLFVQGVFAQDSDRESFDRKMYMAVPLPHFGTSPRQFATLSADQRRNLLACRDVLISLFQSVDSNSNISQYLTPDQAKKYRTSADLVAPETSLMEVGILDGDFEGDGKEVRFHFFIALSSEGNWVLTKNMASLRMIGSEWRIAKLELNTK